MSDYGEEHLMNKPHIGDLVELSGEQGLWYLTRIRDYTVSAMSVTPEFGKWIITDISDIKEVYEPDYWHIK